MANDDEVGAMREELNQLRQAIASDVASQIGTSERRLRESLSQDIATTIEASELRLRQDLTQELARQLDTAQKHLEGCMQMHAEDLKVLVKKGAEGYGGTLEGIQSELKDFREEFRTRADNTDRVLANHADRIVAIEQTLSKR